MRAGSCLIDLRALDQHLPAAARERILAAAFELLGQSGLADLSMDGLAVRANVSRATLYRLFPGKPALFRELIKTFSPWELIARARARRCGEGSN